ncbi:MAG: hypothetical protein ACLFR2_06145 [Candidatus Kapaibacterium sp.]
MIRKLIIVLAILAISQQGCEKQPDPRVVIHEKVTGRDNEGYPYIEVTLKNTGGQPAYFVFLYISPILDGKEYPEESKEYGDILPGGELTERFQFEYLGFREPDDYDMYVSYTQNFNP